MASVTMYKSGVNNTLVLASLSEKYAEYDTIKKQAYGNFSANYYKQYTTLIMRDHDIGIQKEKHILSFYTELAGYYTKANGFVSDFDSVPLAVQKALFDMVFNLGITRLRTQYVNMNASIKKEQWANAAAESKRIGIGLRRNAYVESLFLSASKQPVTP
jgi:hypothetical protein